MLQPPVEEETDSFPGKGFFLFRASLVIVLYLFRACVHERVEKLFFNCSQMCRKLTLITFFSLVSYFLQLETYHC